MSRVHLHADDTGIFKCLEAHKIALDKLFSCRLVDAVHCGNNRSA